MLLTNCLLPNFFIHLWRLFASRAYLALVFALDYIDSVVPLLTNNDGTQTDWLFQIGSRRASFISDKRAKIAGRFLWPLWSIYSCLWHWPMGDRGMGPSRGGQLGSFILPWTSALIQGVDKITAWLYNDSDNYTFYSNFTLPWNLITAQVFKYSLWHHARSALFRPGYK